MPDFPSGVTDTTPTFLVGGDANSSSPAKAAVTPAGLALLSATVPTLDRLNNFSQSTIYTVTTPGASGTSYQTTFPAAGTPFVLFNQSSGVVGEIVSLQMSMGDGGLGSDGFQGSFDGCLRVYVDGEVNPSIDIDLGTLFVSHLDAHLGTPFVAGTDNIQTDVTGNTADQFTANTTYCSYQLQYPIPFSNGCRVELYTPAGFATGAGPLYTRVNWRSGSARPYRLRSVGQTRLQAVAGALYLGANDITVCDIKKCAGWVVYEAQTAFAAGAGSNRYAYLERPHNFYFDQSGSAQYIITGGEEYGATGFYFGAAQRFQTPAVLLTANNNSNFTTVVGCDHLKMHGGLKFSNGFKLVYTNKTSVGSNDCKMAHCILYYVDTTVPYVPDAPRNVVGTAGNAQGTITWTAPASVGSAIGGITGYTVTLSPGGATQTVAGNITTATIAGLTNSTAYTPTVIATNAVGNSAGAAGSAFTPALPAVPSAPTIGAAAPSGSGQATITFTPPSPSTGITGYTATSTPGSITGTVSGASATSVNVTGLTNGTSYTFTVHATNVAGNSAESAASNSVVTSSASVYDSFNRANQSLSGNTTENGAKTWSVTRLDNTASPISAAGVVIASKAVNDSGSFGSGEQWFANVDTGAATMDVSVTLKSIGAHPEYAQLQAKWLDNTDYILMQVNSAETAASTYYLGYRQGATYTALNGSIAVTPADGDVLRIVVSGTTVTAYVNGSVVYGPTAVSAISYLSSATKAGFSAITTAYESTVVFDDFKVA